MAISERCVLCLIQRCVLCLIQTFRMIDVTMMEKRPSSASCPLPTSVFSHGAVYSLFCGGCCKMYGTFLLQLLCPPNQCILAWRRFSSLVEDAA